MKILLLTSEEWNDKKYGNNNMTNWFTGFEGIELAHIYCSGGKPDNQCCRKYFRISDTAMAKSLLGGKKAGREIEYIPADPALPAQKTSAQVPSVAKGELVRGVRDIVWRLGRIDKAALRAFIEAYEPDIVFSQRKASIRILRVEREVRRILPQTPFVVYTADDEYSLKQFSLNPIFWLRRFAVRKAMRKNVRFYDLYYTDAEEQGREYEKLFGVKTAFLAKCGEFHMEKCHTQGHDPIRIVYAGKLYCNRWKTLEKLAQAIHTVNEDKGRPVFQLEIYTQSPIKERYRRWLDNQTDSAIKGRVSPEEVMEIYQRSDIVLHVESFDLKNRLATRYSFSTKIIDCMSTGCALMAICDPGQNGLVYLKRENAAFTVDDPKGIAEVLRQIGEDPQLITQYARSAMECGIRNHTRQAIQKTLREDMERLIQK